ncbi:putative membrane transporter protein OS=Afipia felis OX=1035 GN=NCTC12722_00090 PE=3 SV=1 [Afipia felis]
MMQVAFAPALASGGAVGFSLGLIGGGGSILATPLLLYVVGVAQPHIAIGTGALAVAVNAFVALAGHARAGNVRWFYAGLFAAAGTLGAFAGSSIGKVIDGQRLLFFFGLAMVAVGLAMLRPVQPGGACERQAGLKTYLGVIGVAFIVGAASGFFGIGGGFLIVPGLVLATGIPMIHAVGSSLFAVGCFGLATAMNYAWSGFVDWPVAGIFVAGGVVGGLFGMLLANRLSRGKNLLRYVFSAIVLLVAAYVLYRSGRAMIG